MTSQNQETHWTSSMCGLEPWGGPDLCGQELVDKYSAQTDNSAVLTT